MDEGRASPPAPSEPHSPQQPSLLPSLVSAGLFLYVGFVLAPVGISGSAVYNVSVAVLTWGARCVGTGMLVTALLSRVGAPGAALLDFIVAAVAATGCCAIGTIWLWHRDTQGLLILLLGLLNASTAIRAARHWSRTHGRFEPLRDRLP